MVANSCTPANVYGPVDQTLFLGCSIIDYSATVGWNEQASTVTVHLVEDTCAGQTRKYWEGENLGARTTTAADPGFIGLDRYQKTDGTLYSGDRINASDSLIRNEAHLIGSPAYFRLGDFEYMGIIQSFEQLESAGGKPIYSVTLISPVELLQNVRLIINEYSGPTNDFETFGFPYNVVNVYGFLEQLEGVDCPLMGQAAQGVYARGDISVDGATFGSHAQGFGGANVNDNGIQWNQMLFGVNILLNSWPARPLSAARYTSHGRVLFKGPTYSGYGLVGSDVFDPEVITTYAGHTGHMCEYLVDLSEVPVAPNYWRLNGTSVSLLEAVSRICADAGFDFYVELVPVSNRGFFLNTGGKGIAKFIKIRTVSRRAQPSFGNIQSFIGDSDGTIDRKLGRELRNEATTKFVIGGQKETLYQINAETDPEGDGQPSPEEADDTIIPYFGVDPLTQNIIIPTKDEDDRWEFSVSTVNINLTLHTTNVFTASSLTIKEDELTMALGGMDAWQSWIALTNSDTKTFFAGGNPSGGTLSGLIKVANGVGILNNGKDNILPPMLVANEPGVIRKLQNTVDDDLAKVYQWILTYARDFYGKKFQVRLPFTCARIDPESSNNDGLGRVLTSEEPSDGGWTEVNNVHGLANPGAATDWLRLEDNKIGNFVRFDSIQGVDLSNMPEDSFITANSIAYVKASVEPEFEYLVKSTRFSPRAILTIPQAISNVVVSDGTQMVQGFLRMLEKWEEDHPADSAKITQILVNISFAVGPEQTYLTGYQRSRIPDGAAIGIKSNVNRYGPWVKRGPAGGAIVELQEGLVPWEYGNYYNLNLAGQSLADEGVTFMQVGENGSVTVPGYPTTPLGAELGAVGGGFFGAGKHLIESRGPFNSFSENRTRIGLGRSTSITYRWANFLYSGRWTGLYGPNITGINITFGPQGTQTTYTMSTYTPRYGRMSKLNAERIRQVGQQQMKDAKDRRLAARTRKQLATLNQQVKGIQDARSKELGRAGKEKAQSPHEMLIGEVVAWDTGGANNHYVNSIVSKDIKGYNNEIGDTTDQSAYASKAFMSWDGLLRPASMDGDGGLGGFLNDFESIVKYNSRGGVPPVYDAAGVSAATGLSSLTESYTLDIDMDYLNPFSNPTGVGSRNKVVDLRSTGLKGAGHDINILGRDSTPPPSSIYMPAQGTLNTGVGAGDWDYADDYRFMALRGPLMMKGWGYDLDGKPIPNAADTYGGIVDSNDYEVTGLQDNFLDGWLRTPKTWPTGPVDLRWDRARACWTSPQAYRLMYGTVVESGGISAGDSGLVQLSIDQPMYDSGGVVINNADAKIVGNDVLGLSYASGDGIIAYYDVFAGRYDIINGGGSGGGGITAKCALIATGTDDDRSFPSLSEALSCNLGCLTGVTDDAPTGTHFRDKTISNIVPYMGTYQAPETGVGGCDCLYAGIIFDYIKEPTVCGDCWDPVGTESGEVSETIRIRTEGMTAGICVLTTIECQGFNIVGSGQTLVFINGLLAGVTHSGCDCAPECMDCGDDLGDEGRFKGVDLG